MLYPHDTLLLNLGISLTRRDETVHYDHAELVQHFYATRVVGYSYAAALTFLIHDIFLTFPDEVQFIWGNPWSLTKVAFFFVRYFPPLLGFSLQFYGAPLPLTYPAHSCYIWNVYQVLASILIIATVDYILILRVFAMYRQNRPVRFICGFLYVAEVVVISVSAVVAVPKMLYDEQCLVISSPMIFVVYAGFPVVYQGFLFFLTVYKFYQSAKEGWSNLPIINLLVRDGTWAFCLLFAILTTAAALFGSYVDAYTSFLNGWINTAFSVCGYRVLLNINKHHQMQRIQRQLEIGSSIGVQFTSHLDTRVDSGGHSDSWEAYQMSSAALPSPNSCQKFEP